jgi:hypothetical protein
MPVIEEEASFVGVQMKVALTTAHSASSRPQLVAWSMRMATTGR